MQYDRYTNSSSDIFSRPDSRSSRKTVRVPGQDNVYRSPQTASRSRRQTVSDSPGGQRILYDARGMRVKKKGIQNSFLRTLLFPVLPYVVINLIIFLVVTNTPKISIKVNDTDDYRTTTVQFTVKSLLPLKELLVKMEDEPVIYSRSGSSYKADISSNGSFVVTALSCNGMQTSDYADISILDNSPPSIEDTGCRLENNELTFILSDSQSGINFNSVKGTLPDGTTVTPIRVDKEKGSVTIPMTADKVEIYFEDMAGNSRTAGISSETVIQMSDSYLDYGDNL